MTSRWQPKKMLARSKSRCVRESGYGVDSKTGFSEARLQHATSQCIFDHSAFQGSHHCDKHTGVFSLKRFILGQRTEIRVLFFQLNKREGRLTLQTVEISYNLFWNAYMKLSDNHITFRYQLLLVGVIVKSSKPNDWSHHHGEHWVCIYAFCAQWTDLRNVD